MITVPTTLVLGAGASMPYGFPSGAKLREQLCDERFMLELTRHSDFHEDEIEIFCESFLKSSMASIDAFLARRGDHKVDPGGATYADIGKAGIALSLIKCEQSKNLYNFSSEDNWYHYLWQFIGDSLEDFSKNKLSIITFNYDRSLEIFLLLAIQHAFGVAENVAAKHLKSIPIIHVYGKIGDFSCFGGEPKKCRPYFHAPSARDIRVASAGIRVIAEHRDDGPEFEQAQKALMGAERICFLGFGFDSTNVKRLNISKILKDRFSKSGFQYPSVYATTVGMLREERERVIRLLTATGTGFAPTVIGMHRYETLHAKIKANLTEAADQRSTNYLRHTGVLYGSEL
jgi:hypothetical protein